MILSREESANGKGILCENGRVDWGKSWVTKCSQEFTTMEIVKINCAIKASSDKETHLIIDKYR